MDTTSALNGASRYSRLQLRMLVVLRMLVGWHFLYEGVVKLWNPNWSSAGYLMDSQGWFAGIFQWMAGTPWLLGIADFVNVWGLILIGLCLILGLFDRWAAIGGMALLALYYLSHPAIIGAKYALPSEGSYLFVNKNLIEIFALGVLYAFPTSVYVGLERLLALRRGESVPEPEAAKMPEKETVA
ncbi:MAG: DoxX family membrane protein [Bacteroidia bacterium]|nr:DoxX family membrane protein [Bacteroidia bacterium]